MQQTMPTTFPRQLKTQQILIALLIVALAWLLRLIVLWQRASSGDPTFHQLVFGNDEEVYWRYANDLIAGAFPFRPYSNQPGAIYVYGGLMAILGKAPVMLNLGILTLDALASGIAIGIGWLLTERAWGGYLTGLLMALYPVSLFYSTTFLVAPIAFQWVLWTLFIMLWYRQRPTIWKAILLGACFGYLVATRSNLAPLAVLWVLYQVLSRSNWRDTIQHVTIVTITAVCVVAPFTYWNYYISGEFQLTTTSGAPQLYAGNNRDASGGGGASVAYRTRDIDPLDAIWRDVRVAPERMAGLWMRKALLHWHVSEIGNNLDYNTTRQHSPILQILTPFNFTVLAFFGIIGLGMLWHHDRPLALFFTLALIYLTFAMMISFSISRLRYPTVAFLIPLAGYGVVQSWALRRYMRQVRNTLVPWVLVAGAVAFAPMLILDGQPTPLPPKPTYTQLPDDAIRLDTVFGESIAGEEQPRIELVGWRPLTRWWQASDQGWATLEEAYTIELFWRAVAPIDEKLAFYMAYFVEGERYFGLDLQLGSVSFPAVTTDFWETDTIYAEIVSFLPRTRYDDGVEAPFARTGQVNVGVFGDNADQTGFRNLTVIHPQPAPYAFIETLAWYDTRFDMLHLPELPELLPAIGQLFGAEGADLIELIGASIPRRLAAGEALLITLSWLALTDIHADYNLFVHIEDADGNLVAQYDAPPNAMLWTDNWMPAYPVLSNITLTSPEAPGEYTVYLGLYNLIDFGRLAVADTTDNRFILGRIVVE